MPTTQRYNFVFVIPNELRGVPIPFDKFKKPLNDDRTEPQPPFYSYDELMALPGNEAIETPSKTHVIMSTNITSILTLAEVFPQYIAGVGPDIQLLDALHIEHWQDEDQSKYLWMVPTDPKADQYNWNAFRKGNVLFQVTEAENE